MVYTAHVHARDPRPRITIADDRGMPAAELPLPDGVDSPQDVEGELSNNGWTVSASWTTTPDGWEAPVVNE